jgi:hypothetical protein
MADRTHGKKSQSHSRADAAATKDVVASRQVDRRMRGHLGLRHRYGDGGSRPRQEIENKCLMRE